MNKDTSLPVLIWGVSPFGPIPRAAEANDHLVISSHIIYFISVTTSSKHNLGSGDTGETFSSTYQCASPPSRYAYCHFLVFRFHHDLYCILQQVDNFSSVLSPASFTPLAPPHPSFPHNHPTSNNHFAHLEETFPCFKHNLSATPWISTTTIPQQGCNA